MFRRLCTRHDGLPADSVPQILGWGILGSLGECQRPWICMEVRLLDQKMPAQFAHIFAIASGFMLLGALFLIDGTMHAAPGERPVF